MRLKERPLCHIEMRRKNQKKKYNGRVVLRDDIVTDDSGSYAACAEQCSSASQAADATSAYTQVNMEDMIHRD